MAAKRRRARKNPAKKRRHKRNPTATRASAANPRRRKKRANPKRRHTVHAKRRARRANPKRRHKRRNPIAVMNPRRRHKKRNPSRKRRHSRRNPGIPMWALAGLAAAAGLVTYAVGQAGSFALTQRTDPSRATLDRNRYIGFGVLTAAGLALAAFSKGSMTKTLLGVGVAAGGAMGLGGTELSLALGRVIDKTEGPPAKLAGVFTDGAQQFGAVYGSNGVQQLGPSMQGVFSPSGDQQFSGLYDDDHGFGG